MEKVLIGIVLMLALIGTLDVVNGCEIIEDSLGYTVVDNGIVLGTFSDRSSAIYCAENPELFVVNVNLIATEVSAPENFTFPNIKIRGIRNMTAEEYWEANKGWAISDVVANISVNNFTRSVEYQLNVSSKNDEQYGIERMQRRLLMLYPGTRLAVEAYARYTGSSISTNSLYIWQPNQNYWTAMADNIQS